MATRRHRVQHFEGPKGRASKSVFLLTYGKAVKDRGEKHTRVFTKAPEAGTHHILSWVIGQSLLIRQHNSCVGTPSNRSIATANHKATYE